MTARPASTPRLITIAATQYAGLWLTALLMFGRPPTLLAHAVDLFVIAGWSAAVDLAAARQRRRLAGKGQERA